MGLTKTIWATPAEYLRVSEPASPVLFFAPAVLQDTARRFIAGFPGLVTYAVKSNPEEVVIENLAAAGVRGFDVASPAEIRLLRRLAPDACLHYNNPVRTRAEIAEAVEFGVRSFSVDSESELAKLSALVPAGAEVSVRFKLPVDGAAYNFGAKFGATEVELTYELAACHYLSRDEQPSENYDMTVTATVTQTGTLAVQPSATTALVMQSASVTLSGNVYDPPLDYLAESCAVELGQSGNNLSGTICGREVGLDL